MKFGRAFSSTGTGLDAIESIFVAECSEPSGNEVSMKLHRCTPYSLLSACGPSSYQMYRRAQVKCQGESGVIAGGGSPYMRAIDAATRNQNSRISILPVTTSRAVH